MATRKKKIAPVSGGSEADAATPEAVGRTLADYAARVVKILSKIGYTTVEASTPATQEWAKLYYEDDGTVHRVTLIIATDASGLSPAKIVDTVVTTQRRIAPNVERWVQASGSVVPSDPTSPIANTFTQAASGLITQPKAASKVVGNKSIPNSVLSAVQYPTIPPEYGPYAKDVAYILRVLDIETRGNVVDLYTCTMCKAPTHSWQIGVAGEILCPMCA